MPSTATNGYHEDEVRQAGEAVVRSASRRFSTFQVARSNFHLLGNARHRSDTPATVRRRFFVSSSF
jgi:hypothetical protein